MISRALRRQTSARLHSWTMPTNGASNRKTFLRVRLTIQTTMEPDAERRQPRLELTVTNLPETITLGVQTSREDDRTDKPVLEIRKLLAAYCKGPYSSEIREFALVLRVGGEMQEFNFEGCERIRRNRKDKTITLDIGFPSHRWKGATDETIRQYLAEAIETGILCCIRRLEKDKTPVNSHQLTSDYSRVKEIFLSP